MIKLVRNDSDARAGGEKNFVYHTEVAQLLMDFIDSHKAGSPTDERVYWIHLTPKEIAVSFAERYGIVISNGLVKRQLQLMGYRYRKQYKNLPTGQCAHRQKQFQLIFTLVAIMGSQSPIISMDCKKKERLGPLHRAGRCYAQAPVEVYDHDYHYLSEGCVVPHGIYDLQRNEAYLSIGTNHETADFITDNLYWWWQNFGIHQYPDARTILVLCDAGGANSYRHYAFKKQMLLLADKIGVDFIICHYPPYSSKHNPIEHRVFPHLHRAMQGVVLTDYELVLKLARKTTTTTGLKLIARINHMYYPTGIKTTAQQVDFRRIQSHPVVPHLSYRICA